MIKGNESVLSLSEMGGMLKERPEDAHKGTMGHALLVAGSPGMAGCAVLAAEACLRSGAGKLTLHTQEENRIILQTRLPEACLFVDRMMPQATALAQTLNGFQTIGIGPGIGQGPLSQALLAAYVMHKKYAELPMVLDADALRLLAVNTRLAEALHKRCILTPHMGEMQALSRGFNLGTADMQRAAANLAKARGLIVVLKGHPTCIYIPGGEVFACPRGNAGMATAGSGDVLTGLITGLLAQGYAVREAALLGVWLHATAGDLAAQEMGQECMLASDITRHLPGAFRELHNHKNQINQMI
ncbi:MAG: NAD(P)H-hydrate dehydratase [Bacteroidaceae bacterium]|nr:NAD(P)H-hydrate dehydratase [Bacteroidaceae bacterium]